MTITGLEMKSLRKQIMMVQLLGCHQQREQKIDKKCLIQRLGRHGGMIQGVLLGQDIGEGPEVQVTNMEFSEKYNRE